MTVYGFGILTVDNCREQALEQSKKDSNIPQKTRAEKKMVDNFAVKKSPQKTINTVFLKTLTYPQNNFLKFSIFTNDYVSL